MAVEQQELEAMIEDDIRVQCEQPKLRKVFAESEMNLPARLAFLDSITEEVTFADCLSMESGPHHGLQLVRSNPLMDNFVIEDTDIPF